MMIRIVPECTTFTVPVCTTTTRLPLVDCTTLTCLGVVMADTGTPTGTEGLSRIALGTGGLAEGVVVLLTSGVTAGGKAGVVELSCSSEPVVSVDKESTATRGVSRVSSCGTTCESSPWSVR